jgi:ribosomal protein S18 acetylase RimI-like enzyme
MSRREITVRAAAADDHKVVAEVHGQARTAAYQGLAPASELAEYAAQLRGVYRELLCERLRTVLCAEQDGEIVAIASLGPPFEPAAEPSKVGQLYQLQVRPGHWRRGVGSTLMSACMRHWQASSVTTGRLEVWTRNERARAFYAHHGWRPDGHSRPGPADSSYIRLVVTVPCAA